MPKVTDDPTVASVARSLGRTPAQTGLAWLLHHSPNVLLIPGTSDVGHLEANVAAATIDLNDTTMTALAAVESRSADFRLG
jgi:aryl-alcohol dehydrogenase-like predicted oxidoreductase